MDANSHINYGEIDHEKQKEKPSLHATIFGEDSQMMNYWKDNTEAKNNRLYSVNKMRGLGSAQPLKVHEHEFQLIDWVFGTNIEFKEKKFITYQEAATKASADGGDVCVVGPLITDATPVNAAAPEKSDELVKSLMPNNVCPSDHLPIVLNITMTGSNNTGEMEILDEMNKDIQVVKSKIDSLKGEQPPGSPPNPFGTPPPDTTTAAAGGARWRAATKKIQEQKTIAIIDKFKKNYLMIMEIKNLNIDIFKKINKFNSDNRQFFSNPFTLSMNGMDTKKVIETFTEYIKSLKKLLEDEKQLWLESSMLYGDEKGKKVYSKKGDAGDDVITVDAYNYMVPNLGIGEQIFFENNEKNSGGKMSPLEYIHNFKDNFNLARYCRAEITSGDSFQDWKEDKSGGKTTAKTSWIGGKVKSVKERLAELRDKCDDNHQTTESESLFIYKSISKLAEIEKEVTVFGEKGEKEASRKHELRKNIAIQRFRAQTTVSHYPNITRVINTHGANANIEDLINKAVTGNEDGGWSQFSINPNESNGTDGKQDSTILMRVVKGEAKGHMSLETKLNITTNDMSLIESGWVENTNLDKNNINGGFRSKKHGFKRGGSKKQNRYFK